MYTTESLSQIDKTRLWFVGKQKNPKGKKSLCSHKIVVFDNLREVIRNYSKTLLLRKKTCGLGAVIADFIT